MDRLTQDSVFDVALRRFATQPLSGEDLAQMRTSLLGMSQTELGDQWDLSRNQISRLEKRQNPDQKTCDAYIGFMVRSMLSKGGK